MNLCESVKSVGFFLSHGFTQIFCFYLYPKSLMTENDRDLNDRLLMG